jgi:hypothetical protein
MKRNVTIPIRHARRIEGKDQKSRISQLPFGTGTMRHKKNPKVSAETRFHFQTQKLNFFFNQKNKESPITKGHQQTVYKSDDLSDSL